MLQAMDALHSLSEMVDITTSSAFRGRESALPSGPTPFVTYSSTSRETGIVWEDVPSVDLPVKRKPKTLKHGDILFASRGARTFAHLVDTPPDGAVGSSLFFLVRPLSGLIVPGYLAWFINQPPAQRYFVQKASGVAVRSVTKNALGSLQVPLPSIERQRLFADYAESARRLRANLTTQIQNSFKQDAALAARLLEDAA